MASVHVFAVSSMDHDIYRNIQDRRRPLLDRYQIPYTVLLNGTDSPTSSTFHPLMMDEILYPVDHHQPTMTMKFLSAVKQLFRSYPDFESVPDYIVRINATVYIYFPKMLEMLSETPKTRVLIGPAYGDAFVCGMLMIFSKDVLYNILQDPRIIDKTFMNRPDDVVLSDLSRPYAEWISILDEFVYPEPDKTTTPDGLYRLNVIQPFENKKWYFRIRDTDHPDRHMDIQNWNLLLDYFDESTHELYHHPTATIGIIIGGIIIGGIIIIGIIIIGITATRIYRDGKSTRPMVTRRNAVENGRR